MKAKIENIKKKFNVGESKENLDEHGNVTRLSIDIVRIWLLWNIDKEKNADDVNKFLERLLNDLISKQLWKEVE